MESRSYVAIRDLPLIQKLARDIGVVVDIESVERLGCYVELVAKWNRKINLTAAKRASEQVEVLLADALVLSDRAIIPDRARVLDVGSGAGAPAIPLILLRDDLTACLVEPKQKRVAFLNTVIGSLDLNRSVTVLPKRIALDEKEITTQRFDVAVSRAVFKPDVWLSIARQYAQRAVLFSAVAQLPKPPVGVVLETTRDYRLPSKNARRRITVYCVS
jgi:16S rRNA (guanine527-N7)-methyltransferase